MNRKKYIIINVILFALLFFAISFNKDYLRPTFGHIPSAKIILCSLPNFLAAMIIHLCTIPFVLFRIKRNSRGVFYLIGLLIFLLQTFEELIPLWGVSTTFDVRDIIATAIGIGCSIIVFEIVKLRVFVK